MDIILIPGYWLRGESWSDVIPVLEAAGHRTTPLTLPGLDPADPRRASATLSDQVDAVVAAIDEAGGRVVLVAHSGGGPVAYDAADARVDKIDRIVFVDTFPVPDGMAVGEDYTADGDWVHFPAWEEHDQEDIADLDDDARRRLIAAAVPEPAAVTRSPHVLHDERRRDLPITIISSSRPSSDYQEWIEHPMFAELSRLTRLRYVEFPGASHWPQFTRPRELGELIVAAIDG